jgi:predicted hotdog family 3-hydroxylacyl-ACP dehydratase
VSLPDIRSLLPHAGPMVLLDRVVSVDEDNLCAEVRIRPASLFCTGAGVGGWVGLEYMAQAIGAYAGYAARLAGEPVRIGFLLGSRRYECGRPSFPVGSVLRIHVRRLLHHESGLASFECRINDSEGEAASAIVTVFQPVKMEDYPEGLRNG